MARKRKHTPSISLFPFLSILACIIGTLTLMITGLAVSQMSGQEFQNLDRFENLDEELAKLRAEIVQLQAALDKAKETAGEQQQQQIQQRADLQKQLEELIARKEELLRLPIDRMTAEEFKTLMESLDEEQRKKLEAMKKEHEQALAGLSDQIKELENLLAEIEKLQKQLAEKPTVEPAQVKVLPSGSGVHLKPTFVECAATSIVIHEDDKQTRIPRGQIATNKDYLDLVKRIADEPKSTIVFLLRDDGLSTYNAARQVAQANYAQNGKLPVIGQGKLDLSAFRR